MILLRSIKTHSCKKKVCHVFCAPLWRCCAVLPESGRIFYTFFKVYRHFGVFPRLFPLQAANVIARAAVRRLNRGVLTRSGVSPLSRCRHGDTKCAAAARRLLLHRCCRERRSCTARHSTRAEWTRPAHQVQPERKASWEEGRNYRKRVWLVN